MKAFYFFLAIAMSIFALATSNPLESDSEGQLIRADRHKRLTCSFSFNTPQLQVNHSACVAHCLALLKGYKGGTCQKGVCHCRE